AEGGSIVQNGGETAIGGAIETGGSVSTGGSASTIFDPAHDPGIIGAPGPADTGPQASAGKVDLLLAVVHSISMAETQQLFAPTVPELVKRLNSPYCVTTT